MHKYGQYIILIRTDGQGKTLKRLMCPLERAA